MNKFIADNATLGINSKFIYEILPNLPQAAQLAKEKITKTINQLKIAINSNGQTEVAQQQIRKSQVNNSHKALQNPFLTDNRLKKINAIGNCASAEQLNTDSDS